MYRGERLNSITHLVGTALAIAGSSVLVVQASSVGDPWRIVASSVFGLMLITLYAASTLYHSLRGRAKAVLRKIDHCAIYLLIAGTYTPFTLVTLRGALGWTLFGSIWAMAAWGIVHAARVQGGRDPAAWPYLAMGWLGIIAAVPLTQTLGANGILWLAAGGALYSVGVLFYANDRRWPHAHGIWHVFVMLGSAAHFVTVLRFVN